MVWCRYWQELVTVILIMQLLYHCVVAVVMENKHLPSVLSYINMTLSGMYVEHNM